MRVTFRLRPAQQRLRTHGFAAAQIHDGLVEEHKFPVGDGTLQGALKHDLPAFLLLHGVTRPADGGRIRFGCALGRLFAERRQLMRAAAIKGRARNSRTGLNSDRITLNIEMYVADSGNKYLRSGL